MFEYKTAIITKRGCREDGVSFSVHKFPISSREELDAIIAHPAFSGWKYGISVGLSK
jgi:hypothetical protein